jgi:predicted NBD/HSP70 family sugar kinase
MRIGIDLGGTKIEAALLDPAGNIVFHRRVATPKKSYGATLAAIRELVGELEAVADNPAQALPVGVGIPGSISHSTGTVKNSPNTCLDGTALKEDLSRLLARDVAVANDANCFALSEATDGAAAEARVVFGAILGTGVGGGICIAGQLIEGVNSIAGEWGHNHLAVTPEELAPTRQPLASIACACGKRDCVEAWLSGPAFARHYEQHTGVDLTPEGIVALAAEGDDFARAYLEQYGRLLALALATVINLLDPDVIVLGGGLSNIDDLYESVPRYWERFVFSDTVETRLLKAKFGDSSGVRGAAWLNG